MNKGVVKLSRNRTVQTSPLIRKVIRLNRKFFNKFMNKSILNPNRSRFFQITDRTLINYYNINKYTYCELSDYYKQILTIINNDNCNWIA